MKHAAFHLPLPSMQIISAYPPAALVLAKQTLSKVLGAGGVPQTVVPLQETRECIGLLRLWCKLKFC